MKRSELGRRGEDEAAEYLEKNGYAVIARNYRAGHLETDIICEDETHTVFVEVKTRTPASEKYGRPAASVDKKKSENLIRCAEAYLRVARAEGRQTKRPRIDVVEVYFVGGAIKINHIKNAVIKKEDTP
ncbi:MAG: YraN family protein [Clostridia bacterium]|nr:YraN family protein [Clostridia bacterium]